MTEKLKTPGYVKLWPSKRLFVAILLFVGFINMYTLRGNLSIAIVEMTSNKTIHRGNETITYPPEFDWDSPTKGLVLSMFAYGYLCSVIGGYLATKFGGATIYGIGILVTSIMTLLTPFNIRVNFYFFLAARVIEGVFESFSYSSTSEVLARWSPLEERSTLISSSFAGIYIGTSITYPFCGWLAYRFSWTVVFYATGLIALVWCILWLTFVSNEPATDRWISKKELLFIQQGVDCTPREQIEYPWKEIFASGPIWALCAAKFAFSCGFTMFGTCFPLYIKDITQNDTDIVGLLSAIPNFISVFTIPLAGRLIDYLQNNSNWTATQVHKFIMCSGFFLGAILFIAVAFIQNFIIAMMGFVLVQTLLALNFLVLQIVPVYLAPYHCSLIAGLTGFWFTVCYIITPVTIGFLVQNHTAWEWSICFIMTGVISAIGGVIYYFLGSSEMLPWARSVTNDDSIRKKHEIPLNKQERL